jgi:hypothetical protein
MAKSPEHTKNNNDKPNIVFILSDDFGWGDAGSYGGGENRGMPTPNLAESRLKACNLCPFMGSQAARLAVLP